MNLAAGQDQKQQLLQRLMEQYQANAARAAGLSGSQSMSSVASLAGAAFPNSRPFGGTGWITETVPNLAATLMQRLGPGGIGHPIVGRESSSGVGVPVQSPMPINPHFGSPLSSVAPPAPAVPAVPSAPMPSGSPAAPASPSSAATPANVPTGAVPLGNNLYYHPNVGVVSGFGGPGLGGTKAV
ncbi:MAG: hypothetical protein KGL39_15130 [Patescibacteria group bacterium]|nr:hypothetical protein [Patescibacteria group bacterium]